MQTKIVFRILYAESNEDCYELMRTILGFSEIEVECAKTVSDALKTAAKKRFDLFLLGTRFPDADGFELCRRLRGIAPETPIFFYSGDARPADKEKGITAGANGYLVKPFLEEIVERILQFARNSQKNTPQNSSNLLSDTRRSNKFSDQPGGFPPARREILSAIMF